MAGRSSKKATNLTVDAKLLLAARRKNINLSATLEKALRDELRSEDHRDWLLANETSIEAYAEHVSSAGVFSDDVRRF